MDSGDAGGVRCECDHLTDFIVVTAPQHGQSKVPPWQCPSSPLVPPQGASGGSGQLGAPRARPSHWAPSHGLGGSSELPPKSPISLPPTIQAPSSWDSFATSALAGFAVNVFSWEQATTCLNNPKWSFVQLLVVLLVAMQASAIVCV